MNNVLFLSIICCWMMMMYHPLLFCCEALSSSPSSFMTRHIQRMQQLQQLQQTAATPPPSPPPKDHKSPVTTTTNLHQDVTSLKTSVADLAKIVSDLNVDMKTIVQQPKLKPKKKRKKNSSWKGNLETMLENQIDMTNQLGSSITELKTMQTEQGKLIQSMVKKSKEMNQVVTLVVEDVQEMKLTMKQSRLDQKQFQQRLTALEEQVVIILQEEEENKTTTTTRRQHQQRQQQRRNQKYQEQQKHHDGATLFESIFYNPTKNNKTRSSPSPTMSVKVASKSSSPTNWWTRKSK